MKIFLLFAILFFASVLCSREHHQGNHHQGNHHQGNDEYNHCIRKTEHLSCQDFNTIYKSMSDYIKSYRPNPQQLAADPSTAFFAAKVVAGVVRLAFHDAGIKFFFVR